MLTCLPGHSLRSKMTHIAREVCNSPCLFIALHELQCYKTKQSSVTKLCNQAL